LIGVYPVTVEQYRCFIESNGYSDESYWSGTGWRWREADKIEFPGDRNLPEPFLQSNHPQVTVSWYEANAYCSWLSKYSGYTITLPSEIQWEKAARGKDNRRYPWGDTPPTDIHCNFDNGKEHTTPVGIYPAGRSPFGCYDMIGNVWEWCRNTEGILPYVNIQEREDPDTRSVVAMRGGGWASPRQDLLTWQRGFNYPNVRLSMLGFRVSIKNL
jgi:formylglycine-generating enzyme required for sulfatase activity